MDLGCGDASFVPEALNAPPRASYTGVDISAVALRPAEENL
ncbi:MAG: class I SAM-dependent methyltransferase [Methanotrichaceae archaeon]|nr:class I SAM-dependent methyltransferase [Methanotrichaceae archaeon]